jgi:hypothetical protein
VADIQAYELTWIGLFSVTGPPDNVHLRGCPGAYVTALAVADDGNDFASRVERCAADIGLEIDGVVWTERLATRLEHYEIDGYLLALAGEAGQSGDVRFGVFHAWESEGQE